MNATLMTIIVLWQVVSAPRMLAQPKPAQAPKPAARAVFFLRLSVADADIRLYVELRGCTGAGRSEREFLGARAAADCRGGVTGRVLLVQRVQRFESLTSEFVSLVWNCNILGCVVHLARE